MDLQKLKLYLEAIRNDSLRLDVGDTSLPDNFRAFLQSAPQRTILLYPSTKIGIHLESSVLTIDGDSSDIWPIQGMMNASVKLTSLTITIEDNSSDLPIFSVVARGILFISKTQLIQVAITSSKKDNKSWLVTLPETTNIVTPIDLLQLGIAGYLPFDLPASLEIFHQALPLTQDQFYINFYPHTSYPYRYSFSVAVPSAQWELIQNKFTIQGLEITAYLLGNSIGCRIIGRVQIGDIPVNVGVHFNIGPHWLVVIEPGKGDIFPGLKELSELLEGYNFVRNVETDFNRLGFNLSAFNLAISRVIINFHVHNLRVNFIDISSVLTIKNINFDVFVRLPDFRITGRLKSNSPIIIKNLVGDFGLDNNTIPETLVVKDMSLSAYPSTSFYTLAITIDNVWSLGAVDLKEVELSISCFGKNKSKIESYFNCLLHIAKVDIGLFAQSPQGDSGWRFSGKTFGDYQISIDALMSDLGKIFGVDFPTFISSIEIKSLNVSLDTKTKDFSFICDSKFKILEKEVDISPDIRVLRRQDGLFSQLFAGTITVDDLYFTLSFDRDPNSKTFIATYNNPTGKSQSIKALVASVSNTIAEIVPDGLTITLKDALFAYSATTETKLLFILHIDSGINLSSLPLVGQLFPPNQTIQLNYQILTASQYFSKEDVQHLNTLVTNGISQLPAQPIGNENERSKSYFGLAVTLQLGDVIEQLNLPITVDSSSGKITPKTTDSNSSQLARTNQTTAFVPNDTNLTTSEDVKWYPLKKSFGPVHFQKIGVKCQEQKLWFLLDASLATAGLTISLDGLAVSSPLTKLKPEFHLNGVGIDYRSDTIKIGGAFLKTPDKDEYSGAAILRTQTKGKQLTLSAFGSYTYCQGHPSLFIYALLDYPLGGAPFLFVTGLAAGFGYNRTLRLPEKVEDVAQFPLVKIATGQTTDFTELDSYISPATGELFFAVGIKFTSFKIIDSFALLTVQLGNRSEINVLGLSTLIAPPGEAGVEPIAKAQLAFRATYLPDEGFLKVEAALLPGAYLFSGNCRLSGRFAFYSWFSGQHEGDFVLTLGGYHPDFNIPEHYPKLPRLQLNWQLDDKTSIKGDAYFALCSHTLMAGGHLELTYQSGDLKAWLKAGADFLIAWKPYHYDAHIYVTIGASYTYHFFGTHHITAEVGADLHLWGPDFGGTATIHIWVVQINIDFGSRSSQQPNPIDWNSFKASFLPKEEEVCSIAVQDGLVRKIGNNKSDIGVINPKHFSLVTNSAIPSKHAYKREASSEREIKVNETNTNLGIASMAVLSDDLKTEHIITITRNGQNVEEEFQYIPILKKVPIGLWGQPPSNDKPLTPSVNGQQFVESALSGFEIKPKEMHNPGQTQAVDRVNLQYEPEPAANGYSWETLIPFQADSSEDSDRRDRIRNTVTKNSRRENLLKSLGFDPDRDVDLNEAIANDFIIPPQIKV